MSYYTSSYIGVRTSDGKLYPVGPFDADGRLVPITETSLSFTPDEINELKYSVGSEDISNELVKALIANYDENEFSKDDLEISYIDFSDLPTESPLKSGYFLIKDVAQYESDPEYFEGFYEHLSPAAYAAKLQAEAVIGYPTPQKDAEGYEIPVYSAADYMPYAYIDTESFAFYAMKMRYVSDMYDTYTIEKKYGKDAKKIIILEQG